ncbi:MAG: hypothetical protein CM1200mP18_04280 [Gammaproteobacteria bacterium]|nr:MAG: hypothetical protein CM1200mP18_04280 [Gammaproteobacteria bacterium]
MVCLMAMQGLGKPGVNFGNLRLEHRSITISIFQDMRREAFQVISRVLAQPSIYSNASRM